jgi:hypothetical protein
MFFKKEEQSFEDIMASIESYQKYFKTQTELHKSRMVSLEIKKKVAEDFAPILMDFKKLNFKLKHML